MKDVGEIVAVVVVGVLLRRIAKRLERVVGASEEITIAFVFDSKVYKEGCFLRSFPCLLLQVLFDSQR